MAAAPVAPDRTKARHTHALDAGRIGAFDKAMMPLPGTTRSGRRGLPAALGGRWDLVFGMDRRVRSLFSLKCVGILNFQNRGLRSGTVLRSIWIAQIGRRRITFLDTQSQRWFSMAWECIDGRGGFGWLNAETDRNGKDGLVCDGGRWCAARGYRYRERLFFFATVEVLLEI